MDANAIYYTLSTISQTLAGALAVLVAFVVLRVQQCDTALAEGEKLFFNNVVNDASAWRVLLRDGWDEMVARTALGDRNIERYIRQACVAAHASAHARHQIIYRLRMALGLTVITISLSLVALPFTPRLSESVGRQLA